jgi:hypothetical protein
VKRRLSPGSLPVIIYLFLLITGCRKPAEQTLLKIDSLQEGDSSAKTDTISGYILYPRHPIAYADEIIPNNRTLIFDTTTTFIAISDSIVSYRINSKTKKVLRLYGTKGKPHPVTGFLLDKKKIEWDTLFGEPDEFTDDYVFSDIYRGHPNGGTITKFKYKLTDDKFQLVDSITGGMYSEGYGTWDWLISENGTPTVLIFRGGDKWDVNQSRLLVSAEEDNSPNTYLINLQDKDTLLSFKGPMHNTQWKHYIFENHILFHTQTKPRLGYLSLYDLNGELLWTTEADYFPKILYDANENLLIASGYYFPGRDNNRIYVTVGYDLKTGKQKWSFITGKAYDPKLNLTAHLDVSCFFKITSDLYGMAVGQAVGYFERNINHANKLILFDSDGHVYTTVNLSSGPQNYDIITKAKGEFELVSNSETRHFRITYR